MYMKACCKQTGVCIADKVEIAQTFLKRLIGLLGRSKMSDVSGIYFPGCRSIHSFFMRFSIDVLFLDNEMNITKIVACMKPYRLALSPRRTRHTIEFACGVLAKFHLEVGDAILLLEYEKEGNLP